MILEESCYFLIFHELKRYQGKLFRADDTVFSQARVDLVGV